MSNARNLANLLTGGDTTIATGDVANGAISTAKLADDAVTAAKIDDDGTGFQMGTLTVNTLTANTSIIPDAAGGADIGSTSAEFGDVFIADDKAIKFGNDQDATIEYDEDGDDQLKIGGKPVAFTNAAVGKTDTDTSNTGSVTLDFDANQNFVLTLTGNVTLANPSTEKVGQSGFIAFIQDGTGSRTLTLGTDYEGTGFTVTDRQYYKNGTGWQTTTSGARQASGAIQFGYGNYDLYHVEVKKHIEIWTNGD